MITTNDDAVARAVDEHRIMRRGHGSLYDIAVPGYKANLSDVLAAIALCQLDKLERHREIRLRHVAAYDAGDRRSGRHRAARSATRATRTRSTSTSSASTPSGPARPATSTSAR